jgi:GDP-L-fucose synthase
MQKSNTSLQGKRLWVVGHRGMVGSALVRRLQKENCEILTVNRTDLDLRQQQATEVWMEKNKPDMIFLAAATVGGILANDTRPAEFIYDNLAIASNIIHAAWKQNVQKLLFLGSSCIYPKLTEQPIPETALLTGPLEPTNEWYAIAKIAGVKLCQAYRKQYGCDFISAMPTNLYGMNDNFHPLYSHVLPAILRKAHLAKIQKHPNFEVWGTGKARREFLYVDDLADALVFLMQHYSEDEQINIGVGQDITIEDLTQLISNTVGFDGNIVYDTQKPDGTPRKLLNVDKITALGWRAKTSLEEGLRLTYEWYKDNNINILNNCSG